MTPYSNGRLSLRVLIGALFVTVLHAQECNYNGGWSLRFDDTSCPQNAPVDCDKAGGLQMRCCPRGLVCTGSASYEGNYCCEKDVDCSPLAYEHPKCPDASWGLWGANTTVNATLDTGGWCCRPDQKGVYRDDSTSANYFCTPTAVATLQADFYWAKSISTSSCVATGSATAPARGSGTASPTATSAPPEEESSGMSGGAIAGAVVGGVAGLALIVAGIFMLMRRRRRPTVNAAQTITTDEGTVKFQSPGNEGRRIGGM